MRNNKWHHLIPLIFACLQVCNVQKILKFEWLIEATMCTEVDVTHENRGELVFQVTLDYNRSIDLNMWFSFVVLYVDRNHRSAPVLVIDVMLPGCELDLYIMSPVGKCLVMDDRIYLFIPVIVRPEHKNVDFIGRWVSLKHGHVQSEGFLPSPVIVGQEYDYFKVNGQIHQDDIIGYVTDSAPLHIEYCAEKIEEHLLVVEYREMMEYFNLTCVALDILPHQGSVLSVGFEEIAGPCKQCKRHYFAFRRVPQNVRSTNRCTRTHFVNKGLVGLLILFMYAV